MKMIHAYPVRSALLLLVPCLVLSSWLDCQ